MFKSHSYSKVFEGWYLVSCFFASVIPNIVSHVEVTGFTGSEKNVSEDTNQDMDMGSGLVARRYKQ